MKENRYIISFGHCFLSKGRFQKKSKKSLDLSIQAGWLWSAGGQNPTKKNIKKEPKYKDDQNGLIHPEN